MYLLHRNVGFKANLKKKRFAVKLPQHELRILFDGANEEQTSVMKKFLIYIEKVINDNSKDYFKSFDYGKLAYGASKVAFAKIISKIDTKYIPFFFSNRLIKDSKIKKMIEARLSDV